MNEDISVIVPIYNTEQYLVHSIGTLLDQTYKYLQVVATDDGSWDESGAIIDEVALLDDRTLVIHKMNEGVTRARIDAVKIASGQYIGFMDSDDEIEPEMYERLLANMTKYKAQISHCGHQVIRLDGSVQYLYNTGRLAKQDRSEGLKVLLTGSIEPGLCSKLYSKTLLHSLLHSGKVDYSVKINEDLLMNYYLFRLADSLIYEDFCPYHYMKRIGSASTAKHNLRVYTDPVKVKKIIMEDCRNTSEEEVAQKVYLSICVHEYEALQRDNVYKEEQDRIRSLIIENKDKIKFLDYKQRIAAIMIIYTPHVNHWVNKLYH